MRPIRKRNTSAATLYDPAADPINQWMIQQALATVLPRTPTPIFSPSPPSSHNNTAQLTGSVPLLSKLEKKPQRPEEQPLLTQLSSCKSLPGIENNQGSRRKRGIFRVQSEGERSQPERRKSRQNGGLSRTASAYGQRSARSSVSFQRQSSLGSSSLTSELLGVSGTAIRKETESGVSSLSASRYGSHLEIPFPTGPVLRLPSPGDSWSREEEIERSVLLLGYTIQNEPRL